MELPDRLERSVGAWQRILRTRRRLSRLWPMVPFVAASAALAIYLARVPFEGVRGVLFAALPLAAAGFTAWRVLRTPAPATTALVALADRHLGTKELLSTAWTLRREQSEVAGLLKASADRWLTQHPGARLPPGRTLWRRRGVETATAIALIAVALWAPLPPRASASNRNKPGEAEARHLQKTADALRRVAGPHAPREVKAVADGLEKLAGDLRQGAGPREALLQLEDLRQKLEKDGKGTQLEKLSEAAQRGMDVLSPEQRQGLQGLRDAATPEEAAAALQDLVQRMAADAQQNGYDKGKTEAMADALEKMADSLSGAESKRAAAALRRAADAMRKGDQAALEKALADLSNLPESELQGALQQLKDAQAVDAMAIEALEQASQGMSYGQMESLEALEQKMRQAGRGEPSDGNGKGRPTPFAGRGTTNEKGENFENEPIDAELNRQGENRSDWQSEHQQRDWARRADGVRTFTDRVRGQRREGPAFFENIRIMGQQGNGPARGAGATGGGAELPPSLGEAGVPPAYRDVVKDYFDGLGGNPAPVQGGTP